MKKNNNLFESYLRKIIIDSLNENESNEKTRFEKLYVFLFENLVLEYGYREVDYIEYRDVVKDTFGIESRGKIYFTFQQFHDLYNFNVRPNVNWRTKPLISPNKLDFTLNNFIKTLPKNLIRVNGNLELFECENFMSLPDNLTFIDGFLDLRNSKIKSLPPNLVIKEKLNLRSCQNLEELPPNIQIGGSIDIAFSRNFKKLPDTLKQINGYLNLFGTAIEYLPNDLSIDGDLDIKFANKLKEFPKNLNVRGNILLSGYEDICRFFEGNSSKILEDIREKGGNASDVVIQ